MKRKVVSALLMLVITLQAPGTLLLSSANESQVMTEEATSGESLTGETVVGDIEINEDHFPDVHFRNFVKSNFDDDQDGILSAFERETVAGIDLSSANVNIKDLTGIEFFEDLVSLDTTIEGDNVTLNNVDLSKNTNLYSFISQTAIKSLNVTGCDNLRYLELGDLSKLTIIGKESLVNLANLKLTDYTFDTINLSELENLEILELTALNLNELNLEKNNKLKNLTLIVNNITNLNLEKITLQ